MGGKGEHQKKAYDSRQAKFHIVFVLSVRRRVR